MKNKAKSLTSPNQYVFPVSGTTSQSTRATTFQLFVGGKVPKN